VLLEAGEEFLISYSPKLGPLVALGEQVLGRGEHGDSMAERALSACLQVASRARKDGKVLD
jgi:hypothetical protein